MNNATLAAALTAALAGTAHAQSSPVTIYGIIDAALQVNDYDRAGASNDKGVVSGHRNGSRWGFRGSEDLGDGLSAIFQLENGFSTDTGTLGQGGRIFGRQAYVGLNGRFGTVALGRISTFDGGAFDVFTPIDPFVAGYGINTLASTFSLAGGFRVDNALLYRTPKLGGFQAGWIHSLQTNGPETPGGNTRLDDFAVSFGAGAFYAAATYAIGRFASSTGFEDQKALYIGATYDFKVVKLLGAYADEKGVRSALISSIGATADGTDAKAWMLGATIPFGTGNFLVSFQKRDGKQETIGANTYDADRKVFGLAYEYLLSKRTVVHASIGKSDGSGTLAPIAANTDFANRKQFSIGLTHRF